MESSLEAFEQMAARSQSRMKQAQELSDRYADDIKNSEAEFERLISDQKQEAVNDPLQELFRDEYAHCLQSKLKLSQLSALAKLNAQDVTTHSKAVLELYRLAVADYPNAVQKCEEQQRILKEASGSTQLP